MNCSDFLSLMRSIVYGTDGDSIRQSMQLYFEYLSTSPDEYIGNMIEIFESGDLELQAFCATIIRKNISTELEKSILNRCQNKQLIYQLIEVLLEKLPNSTGVSHIIADLIGEISSSLLRKEQQISSILNYVEGNISGPYEYEISIIVWQLSSLEWRLINSFIMQFMSVLCRSDNYKVISQNVLILCNLMMMELYVRDDINTMSFEMQQEIIQELINQISKLCPEAHKNINSFRSALEEFTELLDCASELFTDYLEQVFALSEELIVNFEMCFDLESVGISLFVTYISQLENFNLEAEQYDKFIEIAMQYILPELNNFTPAEIDSIMNNEEIDINSENSEVEFYVSEIINQEYEKIALPLVNLYLQQNMSNQNNALACILLIKELFEYEYQENAEIMIQFLFHELINGSNNCQYFALEALEEVMRNTPKKLEFNEMVDELMDLLEFISSQCNNIQIQYLDTLVFLRDSDCKINNIYKFEGVVRQYYQNQFPKVEMAVCELVGFIISQYESEGMSLIDVCKVLVDNYFTLLEEFNNQHGSKQYYEIIKAYLEEIVAMAYYSNYKSEEVVESLIIISEMNNLDEIHEFMESLIMALASAVKYYVKTMKDDEILLIVRQFLYILTVPVFEQQEPQNLDDEDCTKVNEYVISTKQTILDSLSVIILEKATLMQPYLYQLKEILDKFDYTTQYQFINICYIYAAMCVADNKLLTPVFEIYDVAMHKTRRTVLEIANLLKSFTLLLGIQYENEKIQKKIFDYVLSLMSMASEQLKRYVNYFNENGQQSQNTSELLEELHVQSSSIIELLQVLIGMNAQFLQLLVQYLQEEAQDFLFYATICIVLLKNNEYIQQADSVILAQIEYEYNVDPAYVYLIMLIILGQHEPSEQLCELVLEKMSINCSYCGILFCLAQGLPNHQLLQEAYELLEREFPCKFERIELSLTEFMVQNDEFMAAATSNRTICSRLIKISFVFADATPEPVRKAVEKVMRLFSEQEVLALRSEI